MTFVTWILNGLINAGCLLMDLLALLIAIRALSGRFAVPILAELNSAGQPLVDRILSYAGVIWRGVIPQKAPSPSGLLLLALLMVVALRLSAGALITLAADSASSQDSVGHRPMTTVRSCVHS